MAAGVKRERSADTYTGLTDILPSQYSPRLRDPCEGEKALMSAILEEAIHTYKKYAFLKHYHAQALFHETRRWIFSDDFGWLFSYRRICEALSIDHGGIRKRLEKWLYIQCEEARKDISLPHEEADQHIIENDK